MSRSIELIQLIKFFRYPNEILSPGPTSHDNSSQDNCLYVIKDILDITLIVDAVFCHLMNKFAMS